MSENLGSIESLPGVTGVGVFDASGLCLEHSFRPPYNDQLVADVFRNLRLGLEPFRTLGEGSVETVLAQTSDGVLGLHQFTDHSAFVIGTSDLNPVMLTVAFKSLAMNFQPAVQEPAAIEEALAPAQASVANPVAPSVLQQTQAALVRQLGPFAAFVLKEEVQRLSGVPDSLDRSHFSELVRTLAGKVEEAGKRQEFLAEVNELTH